ncbi:MAG: neutral/alkaline non-lysosomal ceramidase N-terminal domain-containing protein [Planctomycetaceae bacterium]|nr:neutral/alkaline non-lysosomal ceramidase N-terminal domain-containing protein [Planctomycetaceae bacterium]
MRYQTHVLLVLCGYFAAITSPPLFAESGIRAGAAKRSIVPPFATHMGGFFDRDQLFEGVHDDLCVRAVVLENDATTIVIVGSDLMALDAEFTNMVRQDITAATQIPASHILLCAAHNHSAPSYYQKQGETEINAEPSLRTFLRKQFTDTILEAHAGRVPARAGFASGQIQGLTRNRQQRNNDVIDPQVGVLRIEERDERRTIATVFNFTGHPVVLGSSNLLLSGEFPGAASRAVESLMGGVAVFTQGACGDVTVNRSGDPFQEIERIGRTLAGEVIKTSGFITCVNDVLLNAASRTVRLEGRPVMSVTEAEAALSRSTMSIEEAKASGLSPNAMQLLEDKHRVLVAAVRRAKAVADDPSKKEDQLEAEVQVVEVGDVAFVAVPGELFVEYALELRARIRQEHQISTCLVGYANGYIGYIVTPRAMETGGYEASSTRLDVPAGRTLVEAAMRLTHELSQIRERAQ